MRLEGNRSRPSADCAPFVDIVRFMDGVRVLQTGAASAPSRARAETLGGVAELRRRGAGAAVFALIAVVGSALGAGLALLAGAATNAYYRRFFDTDLIFSLITPRIVLFSVCLSLALGLAAGAIAAWRLVRTRPMVLWGRA